MVFAFVSAPPASARRLEDNNLDDSAKEAVRKAFKGPSDSLHLGEDEDDDTDEDETDEDEDENEDED